MVEKKLVRTALTFAALAAHNVVQAQQCDFTVRATALDNQNFGYLDNSDDTVAVGVSQNGLFNIRNSGLFNPDGDKCGFDPYLECSTDTESEADRVPFEIESDGTITFQGEKEFYLCARGAFQRCDALGDPDDCDDTNSSVDLNRDDLGDEPRIYPPIGTTSNRQRVFENCTVTELVASQCFDASVSRVRRRPRQMVNAGEQMSMEKGLMAGGCLFAAMAFLL